MVPTALVFAARIPALVQKNHPKLRIEITSGSSTEIRRGLENFSFDAGISYIDDSIPVTIKTTLLYNEQYYLLAPRSFVEAGITTITWADAAKMPLCLLSRTMRNRRIIEEAFDGIGITIEPVMETNAFTVSLAQAEAGIAATIVPRTLKDVIPQSENVVALKLTRPVVKWAIGLLLPHREPAPPSHRVLMDALSAISR